MLQGMLQCVCCIYTNLERARVCACVCVCVLYSCMCMYVCVCVTCEWCSVVVTVSEAGKQTVCQTSHVKTHCTQILNSVTVPVMHHDKLNRIFIKYIEEKVHIFFLKSKTDANHLKKMTDFFLVFLSLCASRIFRENFNFSCILMYVGTCY